MSICRCEYAWTFTRDTAQAHVHMMVRFTPPLTAPLPSLGWPEQCERAPRSSKKQHAPVWVIRNDDAHAVFIQCMHCHCDDSSHSHAHEWTVKPASTIMERQKLLGNTDNPVKKFLSDQGASLYQFDLSAELMRDADIDLQLKYCEVCGAVSIPTSYIRPARAP